MCGAGQKGVVPLAPSSEISAVRQNAPHTAQVTELPPALSVAGHPLIQNRYIDISTMDMDNVYILSYIYASPVVNR